MSSCKPTFIVLTMLALTLSLRAEEPRGSHLTRNDDSRGTDSSTETRRRSPEKVGGKTLKQWVDDLNHKDPSVRAAAIQALPSFGEAGATAVEALIHRLADRDNSPRVKAAIALRMMYIPTTQRGAVIKALGQCMISQGSQAIVRYEAMQTLQRFGRLVGDERDVIPDVAANVGSPATWEVRHIAILTLIMVGVDEKKGPDPRVTDVLIARANYVNEPADQVRLEAIMALGAMGRPHDPKKLGFVVSALKGSQANFNSRNKSIRMWTHVALMALEDKVYEKELAAIASNLKDEEAAVRTQAVACLGALEDKSHSYVRNICDMLRKEKDRNVKIAAAQGLGRMKNKGDRVLQALINMLEDDSRDNVSVLITAANALAELQANTPEVIKAMTALTQSKSLEEYQKKMIEKSLDEIRNPKKKDIKNKPKSPEDKPAKK